MNNIIIYYRWLIGYKNNNKKLYYNGISLIKINKCQNMTINLFFILIKIIKHKIELYFINEKTLLYKNKDIIYIIYEDIIT